jgi:hypothetical protein
MQQLERIDAPPLFYALVVRLGNGWGSFIVISRARLQELRKDGLGFVNEKSGNLELHVQFRPSKTRCGEIDLTAYVDAWENLPPLKALDSEAGESHLRINPSAQKMPYT